MFKNQRALIIGGSRGLGELTTKILLMGSARIYASYNQGEKEITNLKKELIEFKDKVYFKKIDVLKANKPSILKTIKDFKPTHFYYFATPGVELVYLHSHIFRFQWVVSNTSWMESGLNSFLKAGSTFRQCVQVSL